ncbi:MAG: hypothetical protein AB7H85_11645 [Dehalococcoidia bacterium]
MITSQEQRFLIEAAGAAGISAPELLRWANHLTGGVKPRCRPSTLNNDGTAVQLCESARSRSTSVRLLADPSVAGEQVADGWDTSQRVVEETLLGTNSAGLLSAWRMTVRHALPDNVAAYPELARGCCWTGIEPGRPGIALYANVRWGAEDEWWPRTKSWLSAVTGTPRAASCLPASFVEQTRVASVAVEGRGPEDGRAKVYVRFGSPGTLAGLGIDVLRSEVLLGFLEEVLGDEGMPVAGLTVAAGFEISSGALVDAKLDICAHCLPHTGERWADIAEVLCSRLGIAPLLTPGMLRARFAETALIGCAVNRTGGVRVNLYSKAPNYA